MTPPLTIATVNLKGGSTKTTTSAFVAHVLAERGSRVLVVDADPQGSALRWHDAGDWSIPVVRLDSPRLHRDLPGIVGTRYDAIVIDTPPLADHRGIVLSALRAASHVIVPVAPTPIEYERLAAVREAIDEAAELRPSGEPPVVGMLLTRTVAGAASTEAYRAAMTEDGDRVLRGSVGRLERFAQAYGDPITRASSTAYGDAVDELLAITTEGTPA